MHRPLARAIELRRVAHAALLLWILISGCSQSSPSNAVKELRAAAHSSGDPQVQHPLPRDQPPEQVLPLAAKRYAPGFVAEGDAILGQLAQGTRSDHLLVLKPGYCYRVVGVAGDGVDDMDLFLYDPNGVQVNQDPGQDRYPVLGMQTEICPITGGAYRLQVQMYKGGGRFALGLYRTQ